ncbi:MAG TPA: alpha/beta hydrolase-fold protein [Thermoanaerobaculia bacterium]|nr:alpha/beta hydrolase-fold protein [Thermoanaerobaculia bacterium]
MRDLTDTLRSTFRRALRLENRRAAVRPGRLEHIPFQSEVLDARRNVVVYLPAGYDEKEEQRFPVLYMHDGQNLFEPERAFIPGQHWHLREAADEAIGSRTAEPMLIVGIDNGGPARIDEYTPTLDPRKKGGGRAGHHARMLIEELKPLIDARFRTRPDMLNTAAGGSSLGGLLCLYLAFHHSGVFGSIAAMSPSVWWHDRAILRDLDAFHGPRRPRLWLDIGRREGSEALSDARLLRDRLRHRGWTDDDFGYYEDRRGDHSEHAWAGRVRKSLEFLFPPR